MPHISKHVDMDAFRRLWPASARTVANLIHEYGFQLRIVGGAVRDLMLGHRPRDVDFATDANPALLIWMFNQEGIEADTGGIAHGTVKAVFSDEDVVDVTCIDYHIDPGNGKPRITHARDWRADALRRDLTINSLSVDLKGRLYDYTGGLADIKASMVRFNPGADDKIKQDPNTILRWYRALGYFDHPRWSRRDWELIQTSTPLLARLKDDRRVELGLASIASHPHSREIIGMMCRAGVSKYIALDC